MHNVFFEDAFPYSAAEIRRFRQSQNANATDTVILCAARLAPWKGQHLLLEALAQLMQTRTDFTGWLAGGETYYGSSYRLQLMKFLDRYPALRPKVKFLGNRAEMSLLYQAADIVVLPSDHEPFGRVLVEAMLAAKPVVAFDRAGPAEIVESGRTGILIPYGDVDKLMRGIRALMEDPARRTALGLAGQDTARERYTGTTLENKIIAFFEETERV
jgi:glycosyltransferase involved in cell wall biosynthesis